ncbi:hypothetical protein CO669_29990 [Bradyrhizobium sp. Y36]|uniref:hypothetical protein n=1 Tax=Bradyrhizobium sp. Y36 TaxID=2035447 RepID=UPI000BE8C631|nr:hypothetical protein [Bradyrhizobium sp. Y36]PDT86076.1 hypothetical protein CO669_29990 [Bradyrhizobium sp. Y36]
MSDADYLSLKWGSLKSIRMRTPAVEAAFERYESIGTHHGSALFHKDSLEQKAALCDLIDAVAAAGGQIQDEWSWKFLTVDEAKRYVLGDEARAQSIAGEVIVRNVMRSLLKKGSEENE